jgi:hypothetical protein
VSEPDTHKTVVLMDSDDGELIEIRAGAEGDIIIQTEDSHLCRLWPDQLKRALQAIGFRDFQSATSKEKRR